MEKQVTSTPPIPGNGGGGVLVTCIYINDHREPAINVDIYTGALLSSQMDNRYPLF